MNKEVLNLVYFEGNIIELSNVLICLGYEDICEFGNWNEILDSGNVVVTKNESFTNEITIYFDIIGVAEAGKQAEETIIKITDIEFI